MTDYSKAEKVKTEKVEFKLTTFPSRKHNPVIEWEYPEFQCLCPVSERHDQGIVRIKYKPKKENSGKQICQRLSFKMEKQKNMAGVCY